MHWTFFQEINMDREDNISGPRAIFKDKEDSLKPGVRRMKMGGKTSGVILDADKKGIKVNGYYDALGDRDVIYACTREPIELDWEELEKLRRIIFSKKEPKKRKLKDHGVAPYKIDKPSEEYLESLPIVTLNNQKYYMDVENRLRRPTSNPDRAYPY